MPQLSKEDHKALGLELHSIGHRLDGITTLLRERYGPENSATLSAQEAEAAIRSLIRELLTQALVLDFPDHSDLLLFY
ncbi:MAG TPA: hypothetical protein VNH18_17635 [Bryobacteraceae bacterium]|jgi:hypothetical protein|nr:hypothetical protein [Bryobacteraceae bacterium]HXJ41109.1 hypothetical protein [Bryobacteraceae bacterium]